jgi:hypothetical protein
MTTFQQTMDAALAGVDPLPGPWRSMQALIAHHRKRAAAGGVNWFTDALAPYADRIESDLIGGRIFVTSKQHAPHGPRRFTIRQVHDSGEISTVANYVGLSRDEMARTVDRILGLPTDNAEDDR